jgi:hypothetical protein
MRSRKGQIRFYNGGRTFVRNEESNFHYEMVINIYRKMDRQSFPWHADGFRINAGNSYNSKPICGCRILPGYGELILENACEEHKGIMITYMISKIGAT